MAREINARGAKGVAAYTVLDDSEIKDQEAARAKLERLGYHGAIVMRVVGRETQYSYEPGFWRTRPYYRRFWGGYWGWGWAHVQEPGYLREDRIVSVETLVYSFTQDELVWAGVSKTVNPEKIDVFVAELAEAVTKQMRRTGSSLDLGKPRPHIDAGSSRSPYSASASATRGSGSGLARPQKRTNPVPSGPPKRSTQAAA